MSIAGADQGGGAPPAHAPLFAKKKEEKEIEKKRKKGRKEKKDNCPFLCFVPCLKTCCAVTFMGYGKSTVVKILPHVMAAVSHFFKS